MDTALNPYTPGAGRRPTLLAGREEDLSAFAALIKRAELGLPPARPLLLVGLRGIGKTVLLNRMRELATTAGWSEFKLEGNRGKGGSEDARQTITGGLAAIGLAHKEGKTPTVQQMLATITSFSISVGAQGVSLGVERDPSRASGPDPSRNLLETIVDTSKALTSLKRGFIISIDEMQDLDIPLLETLLRAQHECTQQSLNFYLLGAGLPNLPEHLAESKSYAERMFNVLKIDRLSDTASAQALEEPAKQMGTKFTPEARDLLVKESGGYPYFIQELGAALWDVAQESPFSFADSQVAATLGWSRLDNGFFHARWNRATPAEKEYLTAMAIDGEGPSSSTEIARRLSKEPSSLGRLVQT